MKILVLGARSFFKAPFSAPTVWPGPSGLIKVGSEVRGCLQIQDIQTLLSKYQLHYCISRQESGSSRGVPDPSASLDAIHPADRSSPHVSGCKDNLLLLQVGISFLQMWSMAPPQAPPLQLVQTLPPTRFKTPSFKLEKKICMDGLWIIIDCTGCRKKLSYTKMSIWRFTTNIISSFPRPAAGSPDAQFCKTQFFLNAL